MSDRGHDRVRIGEPISEEVVSYYRTLGLPGNLDGKVVLELFSGDSSGSFRSLVKSAGGDYASVDLGQRQPGAHFIYDAFRIHELFEPEVADFIVMNGVPFHTFYPSATERLFLSHSNRNSNLDQDYFSNLIKECLIHLKKSAGSFIGIGATLTDADCKLIRKLLGRNIQDFSSQYKIEETVSETLTTYSIRHGFTGPKVPHEKGRALRIVRR